jgi:nucleotide-binding universal stress UspA family protein
MQSESRSCVVVGLDGVSQPDRTLIMAADEAERRASGLAIVTVLRHRIDPDLSIQGQRRDQRRAEATSLQEVHAAAVSLHPIYPRLPVTTYCLGETEVSSHRVPLSEAELLVIGTHGRQGRQTLEFDSVGRLLLTNSRCPVLVVPEALPTPTAARLGESAVILVGVSEHPTDAAVVRTAYAEAAGRGREVLLVNAYTLRPGEIPEQGNDRAQKVLAGFVALAPAGVKVSVLATEDEPAAALLRLAPGSALLVIGGRTGSAPSPVGGSVSRAVLKIVPCPVLAVPRDLIAGPPAALTGLTVTSAGDLEPVSYSLRS